MPLSPSLGLWTVSVQMFLLNMSGGPCIGAQPLPGAVSVGAACVPPQLGRQQVLLRQLRRARQQDRLPGDGQVGAGDRSEAAEARRSDQ